MTAARRIGGSGAPTIDRLRAENHRLTGKLAQTRAALSIMEKAHELLESLAESSEPPKRVEQVMDEAFTALTGVRLPVTAACRLVGRARASHYRHVRPPVQGPRPRRPPGPQALTPAEQAAVLQVINSTGYADLSVGQVWARELDEGRGIGARCRACTGSRGPRGRPGNGAGRPRIRRE